MVNINRLVVVLCSALSIGYLGFPGRIEGQSCSPSAIPENEAKVLLRAIPQAVEAKRIGGKVSLVAWSPGDLYRTESFYFYMVLSTKSTNITPLEKECWVISE